MPVTPSFSRGATLGLAMAAVIALATTSAMVREAAGRHDKAGQTQAAASPNRSITIAGSGDILVHPPTWQQAANDAKGAGARYRFDDIFRDIAPDVRSADLAICHLEAPIGPGAPEDFPRFRAPIELGPAIRRTGYDACSTASNHSMDQGEAGIYASLAALDAAGLAHTGTSRTKKASLTPTIYTVKGVKIGHLSYSFNFNGIPRPVGKSWVANQVDVAKILAMARATRKAGADIIVLSLHAGVELDHNPGRNQEQWVRQLITSPDIDLILGHHAHVVQPFQKFGNKWVAYGLGNTLARHDFPIDANREGVIGLFTFTKGESRWVATRVEAVPIWLSMKPDIRILSLPRAEARLPLLDTRRRQYESTIRRVADHLDSRGAINDGLIVRGLP